MVPAFQQSLCINNNRRFEDLIETPLGNLQSFNLQTTIALMRINATPETLNPKPYKKKNGTGFSEKQKASVAIAIGGLKIC